MADAVLPEAVLAPAIAVVAAEQDRAVRKRLQQGGEAPVHEFEAGALAGAARLGAVGALEGLAGVVGPVPGGARVPVGHVGLADIEEAEDVAGMAQPGLQPGELPVEAPGVAGIEEGAEGLGEVAARGGGGIEPADRAGAEGPEPLAGETLDDVAAAELIALRALARVAAADELEQLAEFRVQHRLAQMREAGGEADEHRRVRAVGVVARCLRLVQRADRLQGGGAGLREGVVAAGIQRDEEDAVAGLPGNTHWTSPPIRATGSGGDRGGGGAMQRGDER